jgi:hypothetical protein
MADVISGEPLVASVTVTLHQDGQVKVETIGRGNKVTLLGLLSLAQALVAAQGEVGERSRIVRPALIAPIKAG